MDTYKPCKLNKFGACLYKENQTKLEKSRIYKLTNGLTPTKAEMKAQTFDCCNCCKNCTQRCDSISQYCKSGRLIKETEELTEIFQSLITEYKRRIKEKEINNE